jgi:CheY-like chemotaxis protein
MQSNPLSVLIIDGDAASRNFLAAMMTRNGYKILSVALGKEGLISAWRDQPDIIILDPDLSDLSGLELVTRLRQDRRTSAVPIMALSSRDDPQEMTALLSAGCSEYLVKTSQTPQKLLDLISHFIGGDKGIPVKQGQLIVFLSAKGGTGTSSLCANVAMCMGRERSDLKIAVMDLVLPIGSIAFIVGYQGWLNLISVAAQDQDMTTAAYLKENLPIIPGWYFNLLAGAPDPESANQLSGERVSQILDAMLESNDFVFVDLGRSLSRISLPIIQKAQVIALILSTDLATAELTRMVVEYLKTQGVDLRRVFAIQNRAVGLEGLMKAELEKMLGLPIEVTMPYMGDNFTVANNRHEPIAGRFRGDSVSLLLEQVASQMVERNKYRNS